MKNFLQNYFYYVKRERSGLILLCSLTLLLLTVPTIYKQLKPVKKFNFSAYEILPAIQSKKSSTEKISINPKTRINPNKADKSALLSIGLSEKQVNNIIKYRDKGGVFYQKADLQKMYSIDSTTFQGIVDFIDIPQKNKSFKSVKKSSKSNNSVIPVIRPPAAAFDPNTVDHQTLSEIGLPKKIITTILNFRESGGKFYKKEDLLKIYGMKEDWFNQLKNHIVISSAGFPSKAEIQKRYTPREKSPPPPPQYPETDINKATAEDWQKLHGIGPYYADKIVNFREKLGGYSSIAQIKEAYGVPDSIKEKITPALRFSPIFRKINVNTTTEDMLAKHPYIKWKQAKIMVNYRNQHGNYKNIGDLQKIIAFKASFIEKIEPYIQYE